MKSKCIKNTVSIKLSKALPTTVNIQYIANWFSAKKNISSKLGQN